MEYPLKKHQTSDKPTPLSDNLQLTLPAKRKSPSFLSPKPHNDKNPHTKKTITLFLSSFSHRVKSLTDFIKYLWKQQTTPVKKVWNEIKDRWDRRFLHFKAVLSLILASWLGKVAMSIIIFCLLAISVYGGINHIVKEESKKYFNSIEDSPHTQVAIVLGALVDHKGHPSPMLRDRIKGGVALYKEKKVNKILMSGDHGEIGYDEVNAMRRLAEKMGVPPEDIFMDHAGFSTYETMYRAKEIFQVKSAVIVTQEFHLYRSVYIARKMGIEAYGVTVTNPGYPPEYVQWCHFRDSLARLKDFYWVNFSRPQPTFLGSSIPIQGDGRTTLDKYYNRYDEIKK